MSTIFKDSKEYLPQKIQTDFLPFKFIRLDKDRYCLTNIAGEHLVLSNEEFNVIREKKFDYDSKIYNKLKSKHFIVDDDSDVAIDLLALKYRTKQSF